MKKLSFLLFALLLFIGSFGQKTVVCPYVNNDGAAAILISPMQGDEQTLNAPLSPPIFSMPAVINGSSGNSRAPSNFWKYQRTEYLLTAAEVTASGLPNGSVLSSIGFSNLAAGVGSLSGGTLKVYLMNTTATSYGLGTSWTVAGFTQVANITSWAPPIAAGTWDVTFSGGSAFTYTGNGLYVAWEYSSPSGTIGTTAVSHDCNTNLTNGLYGQRSATSLPTTLAASSYRPITRLGTSSYEDILTVTNIYTTERVPVPFGTPTPVGVRVTNVSTSAQTFVLTLTIKDAATSTTRYTTTQTVTGLAAGTSTTVNFTGWTPTISENVNITGSVPAAAGENWTVNNTKTIPGNVNTNLFSYNYTTTGSGGYGFTYPGTGIFAAKYNMTGTGQVTGANIVIANFAANTGNSVKAVVLNSAGTIVTESASYTIIAGDLGTNKNFTFTTPAVFTNEIFYVGILQNAGTVQWYPLGTFSEVPPRGNTFYTFATTGGTPSVDNANLKYGIEAQVASYSGPLNPSNLTATAVSYNEIDLTWALNAGGNNVLLAWSATGTFGTPVNGTTYTSGATIPGGGTVLQYSGGTSYNHLSLTSNTQYFYKAWSYNGSQYSLGVTTNATTPCTPTPAPWSQDFEGTTFPPSCWTSYSGTGVWARSTAASSYGVGSASAFADFFNTNGADPFYLLTLPYSYGTLVNPRLSFDWAYATYATEIDEMDILYSTDNGQNFYYLYLMPGGPTGILNTAGVSTTAFVPTAAQWRTKVLSLPVGTNMIAFEATSAYGNNLYLDNVKIIESLAHDVGTDWIDVPSANAVAGTPIIPQATIINYGTNTETFSVTMTITGGYSSTKTATALAPGATVLISFDSWTPAVGQYTVEVCTALSGDLDATNDCYSRTTSVYTGSWSMVSDYPTNNYLGTGVGYVDNSGPTPVGYLFSIAGNTKSGLGTECYKYNTTTDTWTTIASLPAGRRVLASACVGNYVYAIAGSDMASVYQTTVYKYDIAGNSWSTVAPLPAAIAWGKAVGYGNYIYFAGGHDGTNVLATVYVYDVVANTWTTATSMPGPKYGGAFSISGNMLVYIAGANASGITNTVYVGTIDSGNPALITWAAKSSYPGMNLVAPRIMDIALNAEVMPEGKAPTLPDGIRAANYPAGAMYRFDGAPWGTDGVIVAGGSPTSGWYAAYPNPCYLYKPALDTWTQEPDVLEPVTGASLGSVNLSHGSTNTWKLILAGGIDFFGADTNFTQVLTDEVTAPLAHDVGTISINANAVIDLGVTPTATVKNFGTNTETFDVTMTIGTYNSTKTVTALASTLSTVVTFDPWTSTVGDHSIQVCTQLGGDLNTSNDCMTQDVKVLDLNKQVYGFIAYQNASNDSIGPTTFSLNDPGTMTNLNPQGAQQFVNGGTWANGLWYATVYNTAAPYDFITIDPVTGLRTVIGDLGVGLNGLAYNVADGVMYGVGYVSPDSYLYTVNMTSGATTLLSTIPGMLLINLAIDNLGNCYSVDISADMLVEITLPAGTYSVVGSIGFGASYAQDMEFDRQTGNLFIAAQDAASGWLGWVNTTNGSTLKIGDFEGGAEVTGFAIPYSSNKTLNLSYLFMEGLYAGSGTMNPVWDDLGLHFQADTADLITVELHNGTTYATVEFTTSAGLSTSGTSTVLTPADKNGSYYVTIKHRNSIETTSANPVDFSGSNINYAFDLQSQAYGDNMGLMIDGTAVIYTGDVNQDQIVDGGDLSDVGNFADVAAFGYLVQDLNGDGLVDGGDLSMCGNNADLALGAILP